jgi:hypothetical protein
MSDTESVLTEEPKKSSKDVLMGKQSEGLFLTDESAVMYVYLFCREGLLCFGRDKIRQKSRPQKRLGHGSICIPPDGLINTIFL